MQEKTKLDEHIYKIAELYNITQIDVRKILKAYISYCRESLKNGEVVNILGLARIEPKYICEQQTKVTLSYICKEIGNILKLPTYSVYIILTTYLEAIERDILEGKDAEIRGLIAFHPYRKEESGEIVGVNSAISTTIKEYIKNEVRVHTSKNLKFKIKFA